MLHAFVLPSMLESTAVKNARNRGERTEFQRQ